MSDSSKEGRFVNGDGAALRCEDLHFFYRHLFGADAARGAAGARADDVGALLKWPTDAAAVD